MRRPVTATPPAGAAAEPVEARSIDLVCAGCGRRIGADPPFATACPGRVPGDDVDHVLRRVLDPTGLSLPLDGEPEPFARYRGLFRAYRVARAAGWSDERYVALVRRLDAAIVAVDGRGFRETPFEPSRALSGRLAFADGGGVWVKDETGSPSGSHKARHLMGIMLELLVAEETGGLPEGVGRLAIASCGNAALAAAVVARAAGRPLDVFVPTWADEAVVGRLVALGAAVVACPREPGVAGDPTYRALRAALDGGSVPFTCQGNESGLAIEGGETLGWEMASRLGRQATRVGPDGRRSGREAPRLDAVVVQVGGGALASAVAAGLAEAHALGALAAEPRLYAVQAEGCAPLARAWARLQDGRARDDSASPSAVTPADVRAAARRRSDFMWPWETEPRSVAHGILDDETYDWLAVVEAMARTGGRAVVVDEGTIDEANALGRSTTGIDADHTGTAGLAGLMALRRSGDVRPDETAAVLFTGVRRGDEPPGTPSRPMERSTR